MYLLYTDETNTDPKHSDFFIYGGVAISGEHAEAISVKIEGLRRKYGYRAGDILKFNTKEKPKHISIDAHKDIKKEVIAVASEFGVVLFTSFILHKIAASPEDARRNEINRICFHFDSFLFQVKDMGLVLVDMFQDEDLPAILREKFSVGIRGLPYTPVHRLQRVLGFHFSTIGSSNFCSLVDIILGAIRWVVNNRDDPSKEPVAKELLQQVSPLLIRYKDAGKVSELSLFFSPKVIKAKTYLEEYCKLYDFLAVNGVVGAQHPTNQRTY